MADSKPTASSKRKTKKKAPVPSAVWMLEELPEQQQFYLCCGQRLRNLKELAEVLDGMREEFFRYHVNNQRNDFHTWAPDVFHEDTLAEELLNAADQRRMQGIIRAYAPDGA